MGNPPIQTYKLKPAVDDRGSMTELIREDWLDYTVKEECVEILDRLRIQQWGPKFAIKQAMLSICKPGVIKAWHRHVRGQDDALVVLRGSILFALHDGEKFYQATGDSTRLIVYPGHHWHGIKVMGEEEACILYFVTKLYDYAHPDEDRLPPDHKFNGEAFQWP